MSDDTIEGLERALAKNPGDFSITLHLANAYFNAGMREEASRAYEAAMQGDPSAHFGILKELHARGLLEYKIGSRADTYPEAAHALRKDLQGTEFQPRMRLPDGSFVKVGTTMRQTAKAGTDVYNAAKALVEGYVPKRDRNKLPKECTALFDICIETITGVANRGGSTEFQVIPACVQLADMPREHRQDFLQANFGSFKGRILRSDDTYPNGARKYNRLLTQDELTRNDAWLEAFEGDSDLLEEYAGIVFYEIGEEAAMGFFVVENPWQDELWALCLNNPDRSSANSRSSLIGNYARFLHMAQRR